ncbi:biotin-dependent carboxyltransferase family protein [Neokomagataea tanensis]|uniref:Biotin-dependent carboxyltransferase family protein n=3 Tax=Neokomagataea TaxID=1223423 RepID=A0A4Y6V9H8_9PROT|nr:biotin-dependent carboxyltransferase family protein [Neokomagataea thailandica]QDH25251.1 biotin-dependent carboxyltransferase family protein [Neokomagataea tanensis]
MLEILTNGPLNTVQDLGRYGAIPMGVCAGGAMDRDALIHGNILVGNDFNDAGIEVTFFPFKVKFSQNCVFAVTGAMGEVYLDEDVVPENWCMQAVSGQVLVLHPPKVGTRSYLTFAGGIDVPVVLGGRSTDIKGGFGGFEGRGLQKGDVLSCGPVQKHVGLPDGGYGLADARPLPSGEITPLKIMPAAEYSLFEERSLEQFFSQKWLITAQANRVGFRLEGEEPLRTKDALSLFSHGLLPGTVQVPPAGQPIVQMADANTCGGYPKVGVIVEADLCLLSQIPPGRYIKFELITQEDAQSKLRAEREKARILSEQIMTLRKQIFQ